MQRSAAYNVEWRRFLRATGHPHSLIMSSELHEKDGAGDKNTDGEKPRIIHVDNTVQNLNAKLANPLEGIPRGQLAEDGRNFAREHGMEHLAEEFSKGALIAQDPYAFETLAQLTEQDKEVLRRERTHRWDHPITLYYLAVLCSVAACVQGVRCPFYHNRS